MEIICFSAFFFPAIVLPLLRPSWLSRVRERVFTRAAWAIRAGIGLHRHLLASRRSPQPRIRPQVRHAARPPHLAATSITRYPQNPNPSDFCLDLTRSAPLLPVAIRRGLDPWRCLCGAGRKDDGLHGSPGQGRVQLRPVPPQQHAGEERAQAPGIQEDRNNHRRPRLSGAAAYTCCVACLLVFWQLLYLLLVQRYPFLRI